VELEPTMATTFEESLERCLRSSNPVLDLRALLEQFLSQGADQAELLQKLENARQQLRQANRETDEEAVTDVMDFLVGWCSPHMRMAPKQQKVPGDK
jgi:hypothetical protein